MPDFTVIQRGVDSSGRPMYATAYMWAWWDGVCERLGFAPVVTQAAFMSRVPGGGADASAGVHNEGGCFDLRTWNLTTDQKAQVVRECRRSGAAAYLRDEQHGGMTEHIHLCLGTDRPLASGAAWQWSEYQAGRDGLASRGPDYHWRPDPLVLVPPVARPKHLPVEVWFANMRFHRGFDARHIRWMTKQGAKVLLLVECKDIDVASLLPDGWACVQDRTDEGRAGSVVAWHEPTLRARRTSRVRLLSRAIAPTVEDEGMWARYANVQTLTVRATGERYRFCAAHLAPSRYRRLWPEQISRLRNLRRRPLLPPLVLGVDANQDVHELAEDLHMVAEGRGIVGILTTPKRVRVRSTAVSTWAKDHGWTDHADVNSTIERK